MVILRPSFGTLAFTTTCASVSVYSVAKPYSTSPTNKTTKGLGKNTDGRLYVGALPLKTQKPPSPLLAIYYQIPHTRLNFKRSVVGLRGYIFHIKGLMRKQFKPCFAIGPTRTARMYISNNLYLLMWLLKRCSLKGNSCLESRCLADGSSSSKHQNGQISDRQINKSIVCSYVSDPPSPRSMYSTKDFL